MLTNHQRHSRRRVAAMSHLDRLSVLTLVDRMPLSTLVLGGTEGDIMTWRHGQGHAVSTIVCPVLQMRPFDPLLVVGLIELGSASVAISMDEMAP